MLPDEFPHVESKRKTVRNIVGEKEDIEHTLESSDIMMHQQESDDLVSHFPVVGDEIEQI